MMHGQTQIKGENCYCLVALYFCLYLFLLLSVLFVPLLVFFVLLRGKELNSFFSFGAEMGFFYCLD